MTTAPVLDHLAALADPIRGRLLLVLEQNELAVTELAATLALPQSTVSRHLKTLADAGWVVARTEGTSRRYRMAGELDDVARGVWAAVRGPLAGDPEARQDAARLAMLLLVRRTAYFATATRWERVRAELFGARIDLSAFLALIDESIVVGDLGCGLGATSDAMAPFVRRVVAVDDSLSMLAEARRRLEGRPNVDVREGSLEALPIADGELDAALIVLALHYSAAPAQVLREALRTLRPGGRVVVLDMLPHDRESYRAEMGHVWLGFDRTQIEAWLTEAGAVSTRSFALPSDPAAKGPPLFVASGRRAAA